jgi:hypothetical protein
MNIAGLLVLLREIRKAIAVAARRPVQRYR